MTLDFSKLSAKIVKRNSDMIKISTAITTKKHKTYLTENPALNKLLKRRVFKRH